MKHNFLSQSAWNFDLEYTEKKNKADDVCNDARTLTMTNQEYLDVEERLRSTTELFIRPLI